MKVGIIALSDRKSGGIFQYTQSMVDAVLLDDYHEYVVFTRSNDTRFDSYPLEIRKVDMQGLSWTGRLLNFISLFLRFRFGLYFDSNKLLFQDIDSFVVPCISPYPHFFLGKPYIFTLHDMQERYYPKFFTLRQRIKRNIISNAIAKYASKILCESIFVKEDIHKFLNIDLKKISVLASPPPRDFLDARFCEIHKRAVKSKYSLPDKFIFYPAQFWPHKNHVKLIEAFKNITNSHKDIYLVLSGAKQNNFDRILAKIHENSLQDKVLHVGYIDYVDLPYLYKLSEFLVMPSLFESVSIPIFEAFSLEVAVCSSNVVALPEQVGDAGLVFKPEDVNDMSEKMLLYLNSSKLRKQKAKLGFDRIKMFSHENYSNELVKIFNGVFSNVN